MRTKTKHLAGVLILTFSIVSCDLEDSIPPGTKTAPPLPPIKDLILTDWNYEEGIYIAGKVYDPQIERDVALVWGNGKRQGINEGGIGSIATSISVSGDEVFLAGYEYHWDFYPDKAMMWKNGVAQPLTDGNREATALSIFVSNDDVYVAGYDSSYAMLWKNGVPIRLSDGTAFAQATSVFVSAGDVYAVGYEQHAGVSKAILWKNGKPQYLSGGLYATSIFVSGDDVYVAGNGITAMVWKNGVAQTLFSDNYVSYALSVYVADDDVYVAGYEQLLTEYTDDLFGSYSYGPAKALVWKNGALKPLTNGSQDAIANSIFVSGDNVYVVGRIADMAIIWKNGRPNSLGKGEATGLFIRK